MRRKSRELFAILVREHELRLRAFVRAGVADLAAADDIVQETFIAAWRQLANYDRDRPFAAWLRGIARNKMLEHSRRCATAGRHVQSLEPEMLERIGEEQDRLLAAGDTFAEQLIPLRECLAGLSQKDREILDRHYAQQQTCRVIAEHLAAKVETVKKRLQRIRNALRDCILGKLTQEASHA